MAVTINAADCPDIQVPASMLSLYTAETSASGNAPVARSFSAGDTSTVRTKLNRNAAALDLHGRYGGGMFAVAYGLTLSAPVSGLSLNIAAGHAIIDGVVEIPEATTLTVPDATDPIWIWLKNDGSLAYTVTTTPPTGVCCLLGSCTSAAGDITAVDTSGVCVLRGGMVFRETADAGVPADTPPSSVAFWAVTAGGVYLWTGSAYGADIS